MVFVFCRLDILNDYKCNWNPLTEIPDLLDNLKDAMKSYVVVESKHEALKKSKQKVVHNFMERASNSNDPEKKITLDEISEV